MLANAGIAVTKFAAYFITGGAAASMLAEAIHSVADTGNQLLLLLGGRAAKRGANEKHPFGYGRARYVYAFVVSIVLFSLGGLFALYEAYHKFHEVRAGHVADLGRWWWIPIAVLVIAIIMESFSFRTAIVESDKARGARSWKQFITTAKAPELPVVLLEDLAALLGLVFALLGVGMTLLTGNGYWDAAGTAMIGLLLVAVAAVLAYEMRGLLIGESATPEHNDAIRAAITSTDRVDDVIHIKTLHLGPEELLVAAKVSVEPGATAEQIAAAINAAEQRARAAVPELTLVIYLEPDIRTTAA